MREYLGDVLGVIAAVYPGLSSGRAGLRGGVWQRWFAEPGITALRMGYDNAAADLTAEVARMCVALGVAEPIAWQSLSRGG